MSSKNKDDSVIVGDVILTVIRSWSLLLIAPLGVAAILFSVSWDSQLYVSDATLKLKEEEVAIIEKNSILDAVIAESGWAGDEGVEKERLRNKIKEKISYVINPKNKLVTVSVVSAEPDSVQRLCSTLINKLIFELKSEYTKKIGTSEKIKQNESAIKQMEMVAELMRPSGNVGDYDLRGIERYKAYSRIVGEIAELKTQNIELELTNSLYGDHLIMSGASIARRQDAKKSLWLVVIGGGVLTFMFTFLLLYARAMFGMTGVTNFGADSFK
jgi:hypothetical protein